MASENFTPTYEGRAGHYWDKSSCITTTRGEFRLDDDYGCEFGEPAVVAGTGTHATPIMKRTIRSYKGTAGASGVIGVFIEWRGNKRTDAQEMALRGTADNRRDMNIVLRGPVTVKNVGTGEIYHQQTVIGADGGCEIMTVNTQKSLGKSMANIKIGKIGLVFVDPDYEKDNF